MKTDDTKYTFGEFVASPVSISVRLLFVVALVGFLLEPMPIGYILVGFSLGMQVWRLFGETVESWFVKR